MAKGNRSRSSSTPATIHFAALLRIEQFSVQPVTRSVIVSVRANSPISVGPQCATVSASITPAAWGASSAQVRMAIELRSSGDGFVVEMPLIRIRSRAGFRYRSTVASLIAASSADACSVAERLVKITGGGQQRQPHLEHDHQVLAARHTHQRPHMLQQRPASSLKPRARSVRLSTCSAGSSSLGPVNIRRAVDRPIPVVATTRSKTLLLSAFDALRYWLRSLLVTCRLAAMSILPSTPGKPSGPRAQNS